MDSDGTVDSGRDRAGGFESGDVLGRYQLLFPLGEGGMARVWLSRLRGARGFDKLVAIKVLSPEYLGRPGFEQMFVDEARIASSISHANVVKVLELGEERGSLYIVMEWLEGVTLSALMRRVRRGEHLPIPIAVRLVAQACSGLHATHQLRDDADALLGVVHGDVSPQNLVVTYDGSVKLIDFGVASTALNESSTVNQLIAGKPSYMAPEQRRGEGLDRRADVFALGIVLYKLTTGVHPFNLTFAKPVELADWNRPALPPRGVDPGYPPELEAIVLQALALDPADRLASADDLTKALEALPHKHRLATDEDIAQYIRGWFASDRRELRNRIEADLAKAKLLTPLPSISILPDDPSGASGPATEIRTPASADASGTRNALPSFPPWEAPLWPRGPRLRSSAIAFGATVSVALGLGLVAHVRSKPIAFDHQAAAQAAGLETTTSSAARPGTRHEPSQARAFEPEAEHTALPVASRPAQPGPKVGVAQPVKRDSTAPSGPHTAVPRPKTALSAESPTPTLPDRNWRQDPGF